MESTSLLQVSLPYLTHTNLTLASSNLANSLLTYAWPLSGLYSDNNWSGFGYYQAYLVYFLPMPAVKDTIGRYSLLIPGLVQFLAMFDIWSSSIPSLVQYLALFNSWPCSIPGLVKYLALFNTCPC